MIMKKNYNVSVEDNGATYLIVINKGTERFVVGHESSLGLAWERIEWMYRIESQEFTVGKKEVPVTEWIDGMKKAGYLE